MELLSMAEEIQQAIHARKVSIGVAEEITRCSDRAHREYLLELAIEHGVTVLVMRQWIDDWRRSLSVNKDDVAGGGGVMFPGAATPVYRACQLCKGAVDINSMVRIECCKECGAAVMEMVHGKT
jgi:hypothetical protein